MHTFVHAHVVVLEVFAAALPLVVFWEGGEKRGEIEHVTKRGARVKRVAERVTIACGVSFLADSSKI